MTRLSDFPFNWGRRPFIWSYGDSVVDSFERGRGRASDMGHCDEDRS